MFRLTAHQIRQKFTNGDLSSEEITTYFLKRIENFDKNLGTLLTVCRERAEKKSLLLDQKRKEKKPLGKLAGIPILIKDNMHIKGEITTCGSKFLTNYNALFDSTVVRLLEEQGAIILGKTNLDEFAMGSSTENSAFHKVNNPWNLQCVPGGSSGGSSAAVSARLCPIATGSDTGGSIRQPASFCGIVGYKPTYGRVSRYGLVAFGSSLDVIGPLTTNVLDAGLIMEVIGEHCDHDATCLQLPKETYTEDLPSSLKDVTIGVPWSFLENLDSKTALNFKNSLDVLKQLGAKTIDINLDILKHSIAVYYILATAEASTNLARFDGIRYGVRSKEAKTLDDIYDLSREDGFGPEVKKRIMLGTYVLSAGYRDAFYKKAQKVRNLIIKAYNDAFELCNLVAMPTCPSVAFKSGSIQAPLEMYLQDLFTSSANLAGIPGISVPSGFNEDNMPYGLQLLGPQMHDVSVIKKAYLFEKATKYNEKIPPLFDKEF